MPKEIEITVEEDGTYSIDGKNLEQGESVADVARFITDKLGQVSETGHKHHQKQEVDNKQLA